MKKLLFAAHDMNMGGIETSLVTLLNTLIEKEYAITLVLEKKEGILLSQLDSKINIIEYTPNASKNVLFRKIVNLSKRIRFSLKYKNKFDFSASYATYSLASSFVTRCASNNRALWGHADYMALFHQDETKFRQFFDKLNYQEYRHLIFVSKAAANSFIRIYPDQKEKVIYCNNMINETKIKNMAEEPIEFVKPEEYTFVNIGRHDELQKKLTRIIEASKQLKQEGYHFKVLFIGEGKDTKSYQKLVKEQDLVDYILFLGMKRNPYPFMKLADCVILSSDYEGYPVVFLEAFVLEKPILTTDVSDAVEQVEAKHGKVVQKETRAIYEAMKQAIQKGYTITEKFDAHAYNAEILKQLESIF